MRSILTIFSIFILTQSLIAQFKAPIPKIERPIYEQFERHPVPYIHEKQLHTSYIYGTKKVYDTLGQLIFEGPNHIGFYIHYSYQDGILIEKRMSKKVTDYDIQKAKNWSSSSNTSDDEITTEAVVDAIDVESIYRAIIDSNKRIIEFSYTKYTHDRVSDTKDTNTQTTFIHYKEGKIHRIIAPRKRETWFYKNDLLVERHMEDDAYLNQDHREKYFYRYDKNGNLVSVRVGSEYMNDGKLIVSKKYITDTAHYNDKNQVDYIQNAFGKTTYEYNKDGQISAYTHYLRDVKEYRIERTFENDRLVSKTKYYYKKKKRDNMSVTTTYIYESDTLMRVETHSSKNTHPSKTEYQYDDQGRLSKIIKYRIVVDKKDKNSVSYREDNVTRYIYTPAGVIIESSYGIRERYEFYNF